MTTLLAFVVTIALLVVFHELGHYWAARRCGVKVLRFSVGFGKPLYLRRGRDGVEWAISAIPLGGYVKMLDEREEPVAEAELDQAFNRKPVLQRMFIVAAGPVANLLLAILLYWVMFVHGVPGLKPVLGEVPQNTPAAAARMQPGETIVRTDGQEIPDWQELRWTLLEIALRQPTVKVEGRSVSGEVLFHELPLDALKPSDMEGEFLDKLGLHLHRPTILPVIGKLTADGAGSKAGLRAGDRILGANGNDLKQWDDLVAVVRSHPGQSIRLDIQRDGKELSLEIVPARIVENGVEIGQVGALPQVDKDAWKAMLTETSYGPLAAFGQSLRKTWETAAVSLKMLGKMVLGEVSMKNLSGPITIADYAGQSAEMGVAAFLGFLALISISLGVLNLLPIPLLDGGHLLYYVAELAKGSPVSEEAWEAGQKIGIALLGTLMVFAIYNDITRLISG